MEVNDNKFAKNKKLLYLKYLFTNYKTMEIPVELQNKFIEMAKKMNLSQDIISKIQNELSSTKPVSVSVVSISKKPEMEDEDEKSIDNMSIEELRAKLKEMMNWEWDGWCTMSEKSMSPVDMIMSQLKKVQK